MRQDADGALDVLRAMWSAEGSTSSDVEPEPDRGKVCRNMTHVSFDGMAEPGTDLRQAWKERLQREGKLNPSGGSVRDLVLGTPAEPVPHTSR
jgi:hypothetical protein